MAAATGLGGTFLRVDNPETLYAWYEQHLGLRKGWGRGSRQLTYDFGKLGWITGPAGNRADLWQPPTITQQH